MLLLLVLSLLNHFVTRVFLTAVTTSEKKTCPYSKFKSTKCIYIYKDNRLIKPYCLLCVCLVNVRTSEKENYYII